MSTIARLMFIARTTNWRWQLMRATPRSRTRLMAYQRFSVALAHSTPERRLDDQTLHKFCQASSGWRCRPRWATPSTMPRLLRISRKAWPSWALSAKKPASSLWMNASAFRDSCKSAAVNSAWRPETVFIVHRQMPLVAEMPLAARDGEARVRIARD
jgi:hypothetical protein